MWLTVAATLALGLVVSTAIWLWLRLSAADVTRIEYTPLTNLADSAVAPSLSSDGRMLAFIRGENTFAGPGKVYVKILPDGEPVQLTHDGRTKIRCSPRHDAPQHVSDSRALMLEQAQRW